MKENLPQIGKPHMLTGGAPILPGTDGGYGSDHSPTLQFDDHDDSANQSDHQDERPNELANPCPYV